ncbi:hypothetical protein [Larkinella soli]|uniref:hypothetical protein n=1 Tax=Larkinella soli TaxID=1770527 RepID=UPI000FFBAB91|nr:hypothetical protein [Larkinella soli]
MILFHTVCTIRQLPQALTLGESLQQHHPGEPFTIGLADDPSHLPAGFRCPYPLIHPEILNLTDLNRLSAQYTPAEFSAAVKPLFIRNQWQKGPEAERLVYLDPSVLLYRPLDDLSGRYGGASLLLTPHLLEPPVDRFYPDEKYFQNIGLYSSGFLALRRTAEAGRFLDWWSERVPERAFIRFCDALCTDQIWLALVPGLFDGVEIVKDRSWHVGLWNLHERFQGAGFSPAFFNFKGIVDQEGYLQAQNRSRPGRHPVVRTLLEAYRNRIRPFDRTGEVVLSGIEPAYGRQPFVPPLVGWRRNVVESLRETVRFIETVDVPRKV